MNQGFVTIPQIKGDFFNALPYSVNWNFNDGTSPSTLTVNLIREDGVYDIASIQNTMGYGGYSQISIGDGFNFIGYLTDYSIEQTPEQKLLTLEYTDRGADLDRYYVGLHKKYGDKSNNSFGRLILVGKEYHPCDPSASSNTPYNGTNGLAIDPCDPCPFMPHDKYKLACDPGMSKFNIYEVFYTFDELMSKLVDKFTIFGAPSDGVFKTQHVGKLKDVLSAWCSALGYAYYWDPITNSINFIDRSTRINIPDATFIHNNNTNIIDFKYGQTMKSTFARGFLGYFSKEGAVHDYTCTLDPYSSFLDTNPLTLADLIDESTIGVEYGNPNGRYSFTDKCQISTALSYYSQSLRDSWLWFEYWGIINDKAAQTVMDSNLPLADHGNMQIYAVYSPNINSAVYQRLIMTVLSVQQWETLAPYNYYFIVAKQDDDLAKKQSSNCEAVAKNFMGKYWYAYYNTPIPGGSNDKTNITVETADGGSGEWHLSGTNITSLPIFGFGYKPTSGSRLSRFARIASGDENNNYNAVTSLQSQGGNNKTGPQDIAVTSFVLAQRDAKWYPSDDQISWYQSLFQWNNDILPKPVNNDGRPDILFEEELWPSAKDDTSIKLYVVVEYPGSYNFKISSTQHPNEYTVPKKKTTVEDSTDGVSPPTVLNYGNYGLRNPTAKQITVPGMTITIPVGAFGNVAAGDIAAASMGNWSSQATPVGDPIYTIFLNASQTFKKVLPKIEVNCGWDIQSDNVAQIDYHYKEAREDNLDQVNGRKFCLPDYNLIQQSYFTPLAENARKAQASAQSKMSFKVPGVFPALAISNGDASVRSPQVADGLVGIQISLTSNGFFTSYSFEDRIVQPPSDEYIMESIIAKTIPRKTIGSSHVVGENSKMVGRSLGFA